MGIKDTLARGMGAVEGAADKVKPAATDITQLVTLAAQKAGQAAMEGTIEAAEYTRQHALEQRTGKRRPRAIPWGWWAGPGRAGV